MRLDEVKIDNFCSCRSLTLQLADFNPIIGYNNSGKSNILRAIVWLLKKSALPAHAFWDSTQPIIVEGSISNVNMNLLPQNQQGQVAPYVVDGRLTFRRRQDSPTSTAAQIRIEVLDPTSATWAVNPTGLDNAIGRLFPDPLYVEAMDDAAEDIAKFAAKNTIGLLLKYTAERIRNTNQQAFASIQQALGQVGALLEGPNRIQQIAALEADATQSICDFFPGINLHLKIVAPEFEELVKGATVSLADSPGPPRPFASFGHGAQRSVHMALIKLLATYASTAGAGATVVLLIDEPELYLHPQAIEILREALKTLASQGFQVIFSTHSPLLIGQDDVLHTNMVLKDHTGTAVRQQLGTAAATLAANPHQTSVVFSLENSSSLLFSESIVLVEGKTERMVLPEIFRQITGHTLAHHRSCVIETGSSDSIDPTGRVLRSVGFQSRACVDLDFVFKKAPGLGLIAPADADYQLCRNWFAANLNTGFFLGADGFPTRRGPNGARATISPEQAFQNMAAALPAEVLRMAAHLRGQGFWVWHRGAIEAHLGIGKNDAARIAFIQTLRAAGNLNHAADPQGLADFANWL